MIRRDLGQQLMSPPIAQGDGETDQDLSALDPKMLSEAMRFARNVKVNMAHGAARAASPMDGMLLVVVQSTATTSCRGRLHLACEDFPPPSCAFQIGLFTAG